VRHRAKLNVSQWFAISVRLAGFRRHCRCRRGKTPRWWWLAFIPSVIMMTLFSPDPVYLVSVGVGVWGPGHPVMWGWAIVKFRVVIGIGHAGTLISAILFLLRQKMAHLLNRAAKP